MDSARNTKAPLVYSMRMPVKYIPVYTHTVLSLGYMILDVLYNSAKRAYEPIMVYPMLGYWLCYINIHNHSSYSDMKVPTEWSTLTPPTS